MTARSRGRVRAAALRGCAAVVRFAVVCGLMGVLAPLAVLVSIVLPALAAGLATAAISWSTLGP